MKGSYSCMPNMAALIPKLNKIQSRANSGCITPPSNCKSKTKCPLAERCRKSSITSRATSKSDGITIAVDYYGYSETELKALFNNDTQSLVHRYKKKCNQAVKAVWNAKYAWINLSIKWSNAAETAPYQPGAKSRSMSPRKTRYFTIQPLHNAQQTIRTLKQMLQHKQVQA